MDDNYDYYILRAESEFALGNNQNAIIDCDKAVNLDNFMAEAYLLRAKIYDVAGKPVYSIEDCTKVLENIPNHKEAFWNRAQYRIKVKDYTGACADLTETLNLGEQGAAALMKKYCK